MTRKLILALLFVIAALGGCAGSGQSFVATGITLSNAFEDSNYSPL
jgi:hypothetical protein